MLLQKLYWYIPCTTVINLWFHYVVSDRERQPDAGVCTWCLHRTLSSASVGPRVGLGAEVNLRRSPKSPSCCHLGVQPRPHALLPLSAYCHLHASSLLTFWASYNALVTEFFLHMPCVKCKDSHLSGFSFLNVADWQRDLCLCAGHLGAGNKGKITSIARAFSLGRADLS